MCGIAGGLFFGLDQTIIKDRLYRAMHEIKHRGPDDAGLELRRINSAKIALAHTRLSIIDLSSGGHQPMKSSCDRYEIVFNGEIYNYKELRRELSFLGHTFSTESDTEVLVACWVEWQKGCLRKLDGMFAFVVLDNVLETVTCVRDAFGIKPFFYGVEEGNFYFGSEIESVKHLFSKDLTLNEQRAYEYLVHGVYDSDGQSFYKEVNHLLPATCLTISFENGELRVDKERWWNPVLANNDNISFDDAAEVVRENFLESVKMHLRSDVPIGSALSGGVDSSSIVYAMRLLEPNVNINTFSYIAEDESLTEEIWVDKVNCDVQATSHKVRLTQESLLRDIDAIICAQGEPFSSTSIYAQYKVFEAANAQSIKVTLDGQGADELLAGYLGYPGPRFKSMISKLNIIGAMFFLVSWSRWPGRSLKQGLMLTIKEMTPKALNRFARRIAGRNFEPSWLNTRYLKSKKITMVEPLSPIEKGMRGRSLISALYSTLRHRGLPGLLRHADRNSMAFSIESRVPFLTIKQAEFLLSLPEKFLVSNTGETKSVFRKAMRGIVPDEILDRKDKIGFTTPEKIWLRDNINDLYRVIERSDFPAMLNRDDVLGLVNGFSNTGKNDWRLIWRIFNFVRWYNLIFLKQRVQ